MKFKVLTVLSLAVVLFIGACGGGASDADLQKASGDAVKANADTSTVTVAVKDGVATVSGEVKSEEAKTKAAELAKVEGVKSVTNNVTVKEAPKAEFDDPALKTKLEDGLKSKGCDGATVEVKDGVATLRGTVATAKFAECVMVANQAGAKKVENELGKK